MDVVGRVVEDEVTVGLKSSTLDFPLLFESNKTYLWETIPIENKCVQQLPRSYGHQQPTPPPPWLPCKPSIVLQCFVRKLHRSRCHIYSNCDPQLIPRINAQRKACETCANGWGEPGCQRFRDAGITPSKRSSIFGQKIRTETGEETEEEAVEE